LVFIAGVWWRCRWVILLLVSGTLGHVHHPLSRFLYDHIVFTIVRVVVRNAPGLCISIAYRSSQRRHTSVEDITDVSQTMRTIGICALGRSGYRMQIAVTPRDLFLREAESKRRGLN